VRDVRAKYAQTLHVLAEAKRYRSDVITKSSIMLGLGETDDEVRQTMADLRKADVNILTLGQYLQPSKKLLDVVEYVHPDKFDEWGELAIDEFGFDYCASGPMVRSSYKASENYVLAEKNRLEV
jgi:lipoic acid synthetase